MYDIRTLSSFGLKLGTFGERISSELPREHSACWDVLGQVETANLETH